MSSGLWIRIEYDSCRVDVPPLTILILKPVLSTVMECWICKVRLESDVLWEQSIYGASSLQALELAAGIIPALIQSRFPGEGFTESGTPVILPSDA